MAKRKATGRKKTPAKKGKLDKSKTLKVEVDTQENHSNYTEDVLDYLIKVMAEEDGITKQFLMLRMVNRQWKDSVDRVLRNSKALTIQIVFSKPLNADSDSQIDYSTESWNTGDSDLPVLKSREFMHVNDIAADFNRLSSLNNSDYAFELKGPLICVTTQKLPAFISFLKRTLLVGVSCTGEPWTMNQTTLSLVYTDPYTFYVRKALFKECISAYVCKFLRFHIFSLTNRNIVFGFLAIIRLETLFTKIESLYLNITEFSIGSSTYHILYEKKFEPDDILPILCQNLMKSIAKRSGSALKKLDVSLPFCFKVFKGISNPLQQLVPQLEHLGLHYQKYNLNELLEKATEKLKSLKIRRQLEPANLKELEKILISKSTIFNGITSLVVTSSNIKLEKLLKHCKSVVFLKLYGDLPNYLSRNMVGKLY